MTLFYIGEAWQSIYSNIARHFKLIDLLIRLIHLCIQYRCQYILGSQGSGQRCIFCQWNPTVGTGDLCSFGDLTSYVHTIYYIYASTKQTRCRYFVGQQELHLRFKQVHDVNLELWWTWMFDYNSNIHKPSEKMHKRVEIPGSFSLLCLFWCGFLTVDFPQ